MFAATADLHATRSRRICRAWLAGCAQLARAAAGAVACAAALCMSSVQPSTMRNRRDISARSSRFTAGRAPSRVHLRRSSCSATPKTCERGTGRST